LHGRFNIWVHGMDKRLVAVVLVGVVVCGCIAYIVLSRRLTSPGLLVDVYINGKPVVKGGTYTLSFLRKMAVWFYGSEPVSTINVSTKLIWKIDSLIERGWKTSKETKLRFWAVFWWEAEGPFAWYGWQLNPFTGAPEQEIGVDRGSTLFYFTATQSQLAWAFSWLKGEHPEIGCKYIGVLIPTTVRGAARIMSLALGPVGYVVYDVGLLLAAEDYRNQIWEAVRNEGKVLVDKTEGLAKLWKDLVDLVRRKTGISPMEITIRDGQVFRLYSYNNTGPEMQNDWALMRFGEKWENYLHWAKHLQVDKEGSTIRFHLWVFIAYQFQDLTGKWSPWFYGAKRLVTIEILVKDKYLTWIQVGVEVTTETDVVGYETVGYWKMTPETVD